MSKPDWDKVEEIVKSYYPKSDSSIIELFEHKMHQAKISIQKMLTENLFPYNWGHHINRLYLKQIHPRGYEWMYTTYKR